MPVSLQVTLNCLRRRFPRQERKNKEQLGVETTATATVASHAGSVDPPGVGTRVCACVCVSPLPSPQT